MRQIGFRLVQRKFAQGAPIPASSSSVAPLPPERKSEPANAAKNVYHNCMSATSLLDVVSMQSIHKHQQEPLVILERLREDEIPSPPAPKTHPRVPKRGMKKDMCLRSGKRKAEPAKQGPPRKRKKLSSESTDDVPLMYYFNRPTEAKPKITAKMERTFNKVKRIPPKKRGRPLASGTKKTNKDDQNFTFREPPNPAQLNYRLHNKGTRKSGRELRKMSTARWSTLRSARTSSDRAAALLSNWQPKPSVRKATRSASKDNLPLCIVEPQRARHARPPSTITRPSSVTSEEVDPVTLSTSRTYATAGPSSVTSEECDPITLPATDDQQQLSLPGPSGWEYSMPPCFTSKDPIFQIRVSSPVSSLLEPGTAPTSTFFDDDVIQPSGEDWCIQNALINEDKPDATTTATQSPQWAYRSDLSHIIDETLKDELDQECNLIDSIVVEDGEGAKRENNTDSETKLDAESSMEELVVEYSSEYTDNPLEDKVTVLYVNNGDPIEETSLPDDTSQINSVKRIGARKSVEKTAIAETRTTTHARPSLEVTKRTRAKRFGRRSHEEVPASTRLLRNSREPQPANPDVYEFDAELEAASRPPSSLRRRGPATTDPAPPPPPAPPTPPAPTTPPTAPTPSTSTALTTPEPQCPENVGYVDIPTSSHCIQITPTVQQDNGPECVSASLIAKEEISIQQKQNLLENLSTSPALLNKYFNCLTADMQDKINLILAKELIEEASTSAPKDGGAAYLDHKAGSVLEALTYYPTLEEFSDPITYYDKIAPHASKFGLCKIVPPEGYKPPCNLSHIIRFAVIYQYISKMYSRWGPVSRELAAIKAHLRTQSVVFARSPLLDGSEVNLPKLFHAVERNGGLSQVIRRKRWGRVAEEMKLTKLQHPERKLDPIYMRYLLPYATLSDQERQNIMADVEKCWTTKYQHMLKRARNPFQRQNRMLVADGESESDDEGGDSNTVGALHEAEDCIVQGRTMNLVTFKKIATSLMDAQFEQSKQPPSAADVEKAYWRAVLLGTEYIVANTASIDTGDEGYGFPKDPESPYGSHPWNLKVLARNPNNVLRYLGSVLGVTVPTLHMSMLYSTSCWHRDPHGLPWTEYMHSGAEKIWYGIPRDQSSNFRRAVETLCPAYCQNKSIWLASEITMVPPNILSEHGVKVSRLLQKPGEYVLVFPEAHSCSITTGFAISESVYFASNAWLTDVYKLFQELRKSCEPTMFSLEQLLMAGSTDPAAPHEVCSVLCTLLGAELEHRRAFENKGLKIQERPASSAPLNTSYFRAWNTKEQDECEYCRCTLFLSKVTGLTGRNSAVCPEHALRLLETKKNKNIDLSTLEFISSYSTTALEEMLEKLEPPEMSRPSLVIDLTGPDVAPVPTQETAAE